ncbi:pyridoxamine 5'-phosphate oxidase family protein [Natrinema pallidum]|uniref:Pyridoxamine 5'-phosphate oxidase family protein n=1 Tax=Natrinema pallidum TaxID=69527 RepID=A0A4P9TJE0_9EURY|nr:pyridoxamine 5'-phosphate oxidase family protein [Natrinema pallidum]QCW05096.1 pyridoxamine 5'-phosphate oxidase family protein [Natrinema pallidum]
MQNLRWLRMSEDEINEFLGRGGTGVISFATEPDEPPVSIPVSYGYSAEVERFYYRLSFPQDSRKEALVDGHVSFVTHRETDDGWRSVVATGQLSSVSDAPYESAEIQGMWSIEIPLVDIFERPPRETTFRYFSLEPATMTGRKETKTDL